jgi:dolichol-phosphate mannosyltransferase
MPLQLWVQAARQGLRVSEIGVPRLYLDPKRAFGGVMNDPEQRLAYYRGVLASAERDVLPGLPVPCGLTACPELC